MKWWITTDTHFNHAKIVDFGRPADYAQQILTNLHKTIQPEDVVIHLGDFSLGQDAHACEMFQYVTNGAKTILIKGNHDSKSHSWYINHGWSLCVDEIKLNLYGKRIHFAHIPKKPDKSRCDVQLHGHTHGNAHRNKETSPFYDDTYHIEVALELLDYQPIQLQTLIKRHEKNKT